jgi:hypothetical protein
VHGWPGSGAHFQSARGTGVQAPGAPMVPSQMQMLPDPDSLDRQSSSAVC